MEEKTIFTDNDVTLENPKKSTQKTLRTNKWSQ